MAMFEQTPFEEGVGTLDNVRGLPTTSCHRLRTERSATSADTATAACAQCGVQPTAPAPARAKQGSNSALVSNSSATPSLSPGSSQHESNSTVRRDLQREGSGMATTTILRTIGSEKEAGAATALRRTDSPMLGMRGAEGGGAGGEGGAHDPIRGLAAFGSQSCLKSIVNNTTAGGSSAVQAFPRASRGGVDASPRPAEPAPRVCTCQGGPTSRRGGEPRGAGDGAAAPGAAGAAPTSRSSSRGSSPRGGWSGGGSGGVGSASPVGEGSTGGNFY